MTPVLVGSENNRHRTELADILLVIAHGQARKVKETEVPELQFYCKCCALNSLSEA